MYLQRRTGGVYYFRMSIPTRLTAAYGGRKEIIFSLGTKDKSDARFKSLEYIQKYIIQFSTGKVDDIIIEKLKDTNIKKYISFNDVYSKYLYERNITESSRYSFETAVHRFITIVGNKDIRLYEKRDIIKYKDILLQLPVNISEQDKTLSVEQIIQKHKKSRKISPSTISNNYIALIKTIFSYAVLNDYIQVNPAENVKVLESRQLEPKRLPFNLNQIQHMLLQELFTQVPDEKFIEYRFLILLALFTGARLEELARLHLADVGNEDEISFIFIQPHEADGHTVKTASARRRVPLHLVLMNDWRFGEFIATGRRDGRKFVFSILNTNRQIRGSVSTQFSKWFARWLTKIGLDDRRLCFHSLRHTFKAWGRSNEVDLSVLDVLQGHSIKSVSFDYGRDVWGSPYPLRTLYNAICKIDELNRLKPHNK
jgi:integrase